MRKAHFILIAAGIITGIMLNAGCDLTNRYDVRGTWRFIGNYNDIDFDKTLNGTATFTSDGYHVDFDLSIICFCDKTWRGYFVDKDHMDGTLNGCSSGTWTASRI